MQKRTGTKHWWWSNNERKQINYTIILLICLLLFGVREPVVLGRCENPCACTYRHRHVDTMCEDAGVRWRGGCGLRRTARLRAGVATVISCLFPTNSTLRIYWFLHRTFFLHTSKKKRSARRLPIIINLLKFVVLASLTSLLSSSARQHYS